MTKITMRLLWSGFVKSPKATLLLLTCFLALPGHSISGLADVKYTKTNFASIRAIVNTVTYVVADLEMDNPYLADRLDIEYVGDWDNNGIQDLIFGAINGGNSRDYT